MLKQISIYAENKKGAMQNITKILLDNEINIWGSVTNDSAEYGIVRMVVSDAELACRALNENGYLCRSVNVIGVEVADEVGMLNKLLVSIQEGNINVDYLYLSFNRRSGMPVMVFHSEEPREVENVLKQKGYTVL
ncbi:MAG: amino acid-binding protein [Lachnospiraceae bacterium]|nr:amino acid-binding protein [Lachnospiraceae bacterium]